MEQYTQRQNGFTLLEVMIAISILAIAFTAVFGSQGRGISLSIEADFNNTATFLLQEKLAYLKSGISDLVDSEGDFGEEYPEYEWRIRVEEYSFNNVEALKMLDDVFYKVAITISYNEDKFELTNTFYSQDKQP